MSALTDTLRSLVGAAKDRQFRHDVHQGITDTVSRGLVGGLVGAPVDIVNTVMRPFGLSSDKPVGGSEWLGDKMQQAGLVSGKRSLLAETLAGLVDPMTAGAGVAKAAGAMPMLIGAVKPGALDKARTMLEAVARGERASPIELATLSPVQLNALNEARRTKGMPEFSQPDALYNGRHHYQSRSADGYSIDEMLNQLESGLADSSRVVNTAKGAELRANFPRLNENGVNVVDSAVLMSGRDGVPEIFSVIPRGDKKMPPRGPSGSTLLAQPPEPIARPPSPPMNGTASGQTIAPIQPKTQYELAHETARINAIKLLGLPEANTAMDRAKAMGFDTPSYHATQADIAAFQRSDSGKFGAGVYSSPEADMAEKYLRGEDGAQVMPLLLRGKNIDMTKNGEALEGKFWGKGKTSDDFYRSVENHQNKNNFTGREYGAPYMEIVTNDPANIRSRFAAFDPAQRNSKNILAGVAPVALTGLAAAMLNNNEPTY